MGIGRSHEVAREYGLSETTVGGWVRNIGPTHAADEPPLELSERARLRELERRNSRIGNREYFPKKSSSALREGATVSEKYAFIDAQRAAATEAPGLPRSSGCARCWGCPSLASMSGGAGRSAPPAGAGTC